MDLRCQYKKHGVIEDGVIEVKCKSQLCGARPGAVVLHRFDLETGKLLSTLRFKEITRKEQTHGIDDGASSVRPT